MSQDHKLLTAKVVVLVGNDKNGRRLIKSLNGIKEVQFALDCSTNLGRVYRLLRSGALSFSLLVQLIWAEFRRENFVVGSLPQIRSENEIWTLLSESVDYLFLFRCGILLKGGRSPSRPHILNVHCATIPTYGGIGGLRRALADGAYEQSATIHEVTWPIDSGKTIASKSFTLDPSISFSQNEDLAYQAGIELLKNYICSLMIDRHEEPSNPRDNHSSGL